MRADNRWARSVTLLSLVTLAGVLLAGFAAPPAAQAAQKDAVAGTEVVQGDTVPTVAHLGPNSFTRPDRWVSVRQRSRFRPTLRRSRCWYPATKQSVAGKPEGTYDVADWLPAALQKLIPAEYSVNYPSGGVRGVPAAPGRYPLVVFSHGYAGFRDQSTFLTARLASWGFIVAAPDHYSRDLTEVLGGPTGATTKTTDVQDLKATIALMKAQNASGTSPFYRHVDPV